MYQAKQQGRNCVVDWEPGEESDGAEIKAF